MNNSGLSTLDRIQLEIQESIQREKELKNIYSRVKPESDIKQDQDLVLTKELLKNTVPVEAALVQNHTNVSSQPVAQPPPNGFKKFTQNTSGTKGFMQRFIKSRGKYSKSSIKPSSENMWVMDATFKPAKLTIEKGSKPLRNGFIPAEEKMKRELQEFQQRENELREERKKSQPDLMAALQLEVEHDLQNLGSSLWNGVGLKPAKSMANLYSNSDEGFEDNSSSTGGSLKPTKSLADLCDLSDQEETIPGTHSLIMQFESLQFKNRPASQSSKGSFSKDF